MTMMTETVLNVPHFSKRFYRRKCTFETIERNSGEQEQLDMIIRESSPLIIQVMILTGKPKGIMRFCSFWAGQEINIDERN